MVDDTTTILHAPNNVIIDASMPAMIRDSGKMWNADGKLQETKAIIPDRTYAGVYDTVIEDCKRHGAFDPKTMGSVSNIGLMAEQAEEYGSHDTTFQLSEPGDITVVDETGQCLFRHTVQSGDIWRMCRVKHTPVMNWIQLGIDRCLSTNTPAVFFLDENRPHDRELIKKVTRVQDDHTDPLDVHILSPKSATQFTLNRLRDGLDTISVTGNVLRDYLTDLFPILELGTSSKMQSIVPLLSGGGLFETGAGGSAPRHIQQFLKDGHLRWNSLGEFLAIGACLGHIHTTFNMESAEILSRCLDTATAQILLQDCAPMPNPGERDTLETHFYLAQYWTQALHEHGSPLGDQYSSLYQSLTDNESQIVSEFRDAQGTAKHIGGYYHPSPAQLDRLLRPSPTFNQCLQNWATSQ
jgi:isocitrate dehydrogenase